MGRMLVSRCARCKHGLWLACWSAGLLSLLAAQNNAPASHCWGAHPAFQNLHSLQSNTSCCARSLTRSFTQDGILLLHKEGRLA